MLRDVYIGLGSNTGDRRSALQRALAALALRLAAPIRPSRPFETEPRLDLDQPTFLNMAAHLRTDLGPRALLDILLDVEAHLGRLRDADRPKGPRHIDLDLLLVGDLVLDEPGLHLPHPGLPLRRFVLAPMADIAPDALVPGLDLTITALLERCPDLGWVRPLPHLPSLDPRSS